ncbi:hypothetical protein WJX73_007488 [Symbiochloris irregularis]|uniref:Peptidase M24 domain-containing protein n=1 Tax=Symbiochloris irregularis TaxID=706552 RepID=A0AAW1PVZ6_9CHLO
MSVSGSESEDQPELDLSNTDVVTKYKAAADLTNGALAHVVKLCTAGTKVVEICEKGDQFITEAAVKVYKAKKGGKDIEKGLAFPTCLSVNSVVGHSSPLAEDATELKEGDVVKIDLAAHIDGFIATAAHTVSVAGSDGASVTGRAADVIQAAQTALEAAVRLFRPGKTSAEIPGILEKIAEAHGCHLVEGVLSHQLKQFIIDGNKCVLNKPGPEARVDDIAFEENEVYGIDILVSTGEGKARVTDERETTVFKRALDEQYHLKMKAARSVFSEINRKFPAMPFTLRAIEGRGSRLGLVECLNHGLLHAYPVLHEKQGELVAQAKATVLLMPSGVHRITSAPAQTLNSEKQIEDEEVKKLLQSSLKAKKKSKKKGKGGGDASDAKEDADMPKLEDSEQ